MCWRRLCRHKKKYQLHLGTSTKSLPLYINAMMVKMSHHVKIFQVKMQNSYKHKQAVPPLVTSAALVSVYKNVETSLPFFVTFSPINNGLGSFWCSFWSGHGSSGLRQWRRGSRVVSRAWFRVPDGHSALIASFSDSPVFPSVADRSCIPRAAGCEWLRTGVNAAN